MKINEFAGISGITTKQLIAEIHVQHPGLKLKANDELPENFERIIQEQAQEYAKEALDITLPETTGNIAQTGEDALVDPKVTEAFHYGLLEAITRTRRADFELEGMVAGVEDIQAFRTSYDATWSLFHSDELRIQEARNQGLSARLDAIAEQKKTAGNQLGKSSVIQDSVTNGKQQLRDRLTELLG